MTSSSNRHQYFCSEARFPQSLCNERCQNILYKAVLEHFKEIKWIVVLLLTSKSFQNSSFGANFVVNFVVDGETITLFESVLSPSCCFSLQLVPSLRIDQSSYDSEKASRSISNFVGELVHTKYFHLSLRSLTLDYIANEILVFLFGNSTKEWPQLHALALENCDLSDIVLEAICNNAIHVRTLNLSFNSIADATLEQISKLDSITSLSLCDCDKITDAALDHVAQLPKITFLNLYGCKKITDVGLEHLAKISNMSSLNLAGCKRITDIGLEHLSKLSEISSLSLADCNRITDSGLEHLSKLSRITSVDLSACAVLTDAGVEHLSKLPNITSLSLHCCYKITDSSLERLAKLSAITSLDLSGCRKISDAGLERLSKFRVLTSLNLSYCNRITDAGLEHLCALPCITSLNLYDCFNITAAGVRNIMKFADIAYPCDLSDVETNTDFKSTTCTSCSGKVAEPKNEAHKIPFAFRYSILCFLFFSVVFFAWYCNAQLLVEWFLNFSGFSWG